MTFVSLPARAIHQPLTKAIYDILAADLDHLYGKGVTAIYDTTLAAPAASIDITGIVATYAHLRLVLLLRESDAVGVVSGSCRFNGDSGANYHSSSLQASGAVVSGLAGVGSTSIANILSLGSTATAARFTLHEIVIPAYALTTAHKGMFGTSMWSLDDTSGGQGVRTISGLWKSTAAINRITISPAGGNFVAGSRATLYGMGA